MSSVRGIDIELQRDPPVFYAGEVVRGTVSFDIAGIRPLSRSPDSSDWRIKGPLAPSELDAIVWTTMARLHSKTRGTPSAGITSRLG